jgi:hypothetical protein
MTKPPELTIKTTATGLKSIAIVHDPGEQERGLALLRAVLPALTAVDREVKRAARRALVEERQVRDRCGVESPCEDAR